MNQIKGMSIRYASSELIWQTKFNCPGFIFYCFEVSITSDEYKKCKVGFLCPAVSCLQCWVKPIICFPPSNSTSLSLDSKKCATNKHRATILNTTGSICVTKKKSQKCIPNGLYIRPQMCTHHFRALVLFMGLFNNLQTRAIGNDAFKRSVITFRNIISCKNKFGYLRKLLHCAGSWLNNS